MIYADDTQIYSVKSKSPDSYSTMSKLEACIEDIRSWSLANGLKLNDSKTELIHISSKFRSVSPIQSFQIGTAHIEPVQKARNLDVVFDSHLTMDPHVNNVCRAASLALHKIGKIRNYLDQQTTETLVHAFVSSRLDNCNSLLYGLPDSRLKKLQHIQNSAARLVTLKKSSDHITPILRSLHWLPIADRIKYKVLLLTFKCLHSSAPTYLQDLVVQYTPSRRLRSSSKLLLSSPPVSTKYYGHRSFQYSAAYLWNNLPAKVKEARTLTNFKTLLKTYLFSSL